MEFGVGNGNNAADEVTAADYPQIRLFVVDKKVARDPQSGTVGSWLPCSPDSIKRGTWNGFSAVGYFFGRNLYQKSARSYWANPVIVGRNTGGKHGR